MIKKIGIVDVAKASGVSAATVSQVLGGGSRPVHAETRDRIIETARALGYRPNALARALITKRMNTIGVVIQHADRTGLTNPILYAILDGILSTATRQKQFATLAPYGAWDTANAPLPALFDGRVDGVILVAPPSELIAVDHLVESSVPFVMIGARSENPLASSIDVDNFAAAEQISRYLISEGHRRIAFFSHIEGHHQFVDERLAGFRHAMTSAGIDPDPARIVLQARNPDDIDSLLIGNESGRPSAIQCASDNCALTVIRRLEQIGLRVPDDISITGFDDIDAAAVSSPPLTTQRQPAAAIGEQAAEMLLLQIRGGREPGTKLLIPTELVLRSSVSRLP